MIRSTLKKLLGRVLGKKTPPATGPRPMPPRQPPARPVVEEEDRGHDHGHSHDHGHGHDHGGEREPSPAKIAPPTLVEAPAPVAAPVEAPPAEEPAAEEPTAVDKKAPKRVVEVTAEDTPNPNARKFSTSVTVVEKGSLSFNNAGEADAHPLGKALWAVGGVRGVFAVKDFVTVTKEEGADWAKLSPKVVKALKKALA
jgi:hypothetical protein